ncbi:MAG: phosphodiester glycosidase family protein [Candidatus Kapabacteria bacterium]|nr:phosphodiester glycosidase family protein [Candidatus Kapabacteria bacterium]
MTCNSYSKKIKFSVLSEKKIENGLKYKNILFGTKKVKISAHVLEYNLNNKDLVLNIVKPMNTISENARLHDMVAEFDSINHTQTLAAVNGSFWQGGSLYPIGSLIIDNEIVNSTRYKKWSSIAFDDKNTPYLDSFELNCTYNYKNACFYLSNINKRIDTNGIVFYNRFGGDSIPYINHKKIDDYLSDAIKEWNALREMSDSTEDNEQVFDTNKIREERYLSDKRLKKELGLTKIILKAIGIPLINRQFSYIVQGITNEITKVPENGAILSFGKDVDKNLIPHYNDTITFDFKTNINSDILFVKGLSGTPRIVRNGIGNHEANIEGSKAKRFLNQSLPRTAIGFNKDKSKLFFVTVEPTARKAKIKGASLNEIAWIMETIGCYNALNLDGGGSSIMLMNNKNINLKSRPDFSRKLSVGILISKKSKN